MWPALITKPVSKTITSSSIQNLSLILSIYACQVHQYQMMPHPSKFSKNRANNYIITDWSWKSTCSKKDCHYIWYCQISTHIYITRNKWCLLINLDISHHCLIAVHLWRHKKWLNFPQFCKKMKIFAFSLYILPLEA